MTQLTAAKLSRTAVIRLVPLQHPPNRCPRMLRTIERTRCTQLNLTLIRPRPRQPLFGKRPALRVNYPPLALDTDLHHPTANPVAFSILYRRHTPPSAHKPFLCALC